MPVVAIANQKGGVGKTTTAINLGAALARSGRRILLIDGDPQSNATSGLGLTPGDTPTLYEVLTDGRSVAGCLRETSEPGLTILPASRDLAGAEVELAGLPDRERRLQVAIATLRSGYDYVLVDCAPSLGLLTLNALTASDRVLIPVQCEYLALEGLGYLADTIARVGEHLNPALTIGGVLLTMFDSRTRLSQEVVRQVRAHFPQTYRTVIPRSVRLGEAPSFGQTIFQYAPDSRGAETYRALAREFLDREEGGGLAPAGGPTETSAEPRDRVAASERDHVAPVDRDQVAAVGGVV